MKDASMKKDSAPSSEESLMDRYPFVKPEVWETPMTNEEFKGFVAKMEETRNRMVAEGRL